MGSAAFQSVFRKLVTRPTAISIADPAQYDCPLVFVNPAFTALTGYSEASCLGRNCRFLQGPEACGEAVARIRAAVGARSAVNVRLDNRRENGRRLKNHLFLDRLTCPNGSVLLMACQFDVSADDAPAIIERTDGAFAEIETVAMTTFSRSRDLLDDARHRVAEHTFAVARSYLNSRLPRSFASDSAPLSG